jgi:tetratricopeptide (TPR) repeat protein
MRRNRLHVLLTTLAVACGSWTAGCSKQESTAAEARTGSAATPPPASGGKIPITTSSAEAKAEFLKGQDMVDKLLITDSVQHFQKAVSLDPKFARAELSLANTAPTGAGFFEHLHKAVGLAAGTSEGERLLILATEAGANADALKQRDYLEQLVTKYPNDERAHFNLGGYYFGQQDYAKAVAHYTKATQIAPAYSSAYNLLGYAYRQSGDYPSAEKAFQKYIELIPSDPNPYDSYAELLLKMGRFDDSIAQYRKALAIDPNFVNAHQGIAMDLLYSGKPGEAEKELAEFSRKARTDAEKRTALFARTVVHVDAGQTAKALTEVDERYAIGEKTHDVPGMAFDLGLKGLILVENGKADAAQKAFETGFRLVQDSSLSQEVKDNGKLVSHYNRARVALAREDLAEARKEAGVFREGAASSKNPFQIKNAHELDGTIALAEKDYDRAIAELSQANQQNPQDLYRLCQAYAAKGDKTMAGEMCKKAGEFNGLPSLNYAFVRTKAKAFSN